MRVQAEYQALPTNVRANLRRMSVKDPFSASVAAAEAEAADAALQGGSGGMSASRGDRQESVFHHDEVWFASDWLVVCLFVYLFVKACFDQDTCERREKESSLWSWGV